MFLASTHRYVNPFLNYNVKYLHMRFYFCKAIKIAPLFLLLFLLNSQNGHAQLFVADTLGCEDLVQTLAGDGVSISNIVCNCPDDGSGAMAFGQFECIDCNLGMERGLILTSGSIENAIGPNDEAGAAQGNNAPGDPDLDMIAGVMGTNDACVVQFDVEVAADSLLFRYVFGSEEYLEFVGQFNDVFAFFISGPGITGLQNIALIPGTSTPVSINNVNDVTNPAYYVNNGDGFVTPQSTDPLYIQYDGFTTVLEARAEVIPCETYTLKLAVADDSDFTLDSGVFIEAESLTTNAVSISTSTTLAAEGFDFTVEGCVEGLIDFSTDYPASDTTIIYFELLGEAQNGVDFVEIPDSIVLLPGESERQLSIVPFNDGIDEGVEQLIIKITNTTLCNSSTVDSAFINIQDNIVAEAYPTQVQTCSGNGVQLLVTGGVTCTWQPADFLTDPNSCAPIAVPSQSMNYMAITNIGPCADTAYVDVMLDDDFDPQLDPDKTICEGETTQLNASGGTFYQWSPTDGLSCPTCSSPIFSGLTSTTYYVTFFDEVGCSFQDSISVTVGDPSISIPNDTVILCNGESQQPDYSGYESYAWSPSAGLSCTDCPNPIVSPDESTLYRIDYFNGTCTLKTELQVWVGNPIANAGEDVQGCETLEGTLGGAQVLDGFTYAWSPTTDLDNPFAAQPNISATPPPPFGMNKTYTLTVADTLGCFAEDDVVVRVDPAPTIFVLPDTIVRGLSTALVVEGIGEDAAITWSPIDGLNAPASGNTLASPQETTEYSVTAITPAGCESHTTVTVTVEDAPEISVPSAFSPNGDGINDMLRISHYNIERVLYFEVFNRWGKKVFESAPDDIAAEWNGEFEGEPQPIGAYVYQLEYVEAGSSLVKVLKGNVTLIR